MSVYLYHTSMYVLYMYVYIYDHCKYLFQGMERKTNQSTCLESCKHLFHLYKMTRTTFVPLFLATIRLSLCVEDPQFLQLFLRLVSLFHKYVNHLKLVCILVNFTGTKLSIQYTVNRGGEDLHVWANMQQKSPMPFCNNYLVSFPDPPTRRERVFSCIH